MRYILSVLLIFSLSFNQEKVFGQGWQSAVFIKSYDGLSFGTNVTTDRFGNVFMAATYDGRGVFLDSFFFPGISNSYFVIAAKYDSSGRLIWGTSNCLGTGYPINMATDSYGNLFILGMCDNAFKWQAHFVEDTVPYMYFMAKINPYAEVQWVKPVAPVVNHVAPSTPLISGWLAIDNNDNVIVTGGLVDTVNNIAGHILRGRGGADIFINKYDNDGNLIWTKGFGGGGDDLAYGLSTTVSGNFYVTGSFLSDTLAFDSVLLCQHGGGYGQGNVFLAKFNAAGNVLWAKSSVGYGIGVAVGADLGENVYITGMADSIRFDTIGYAHSGSCVCTDETFITKYNSVGAVEWVRKLDNTGPEYLNGIAVDGCNNVWISVDVSGLSSTVFPSILVEYAPDGMLLERATLSSAVFGNQIAIDPYRNVYFASKYYLNMMYGGTYLTIGPSRYYVSSNGGDGYVAKYKPSTMTMGTTFGHSDTSFCSAAVKALNPPRGYLAYSWIDGTWGDSHPVADATPFVVTCYPTDCSMPMLVDTFGITIDSFHSFSLGADTSSCVPFYLQAPSWPGANMWQDSSVTDSYFVSSSGTYFLTRTELSCIFTDTINVTIDSIPCVGPAHRDLAGMVPSAFTPNSDGVNDILTPVFEHGVHVSDYAFRIFDRFGKLVYSSSNPVEGWDGSVGGRAAPMGVYIYFLTYKTSNGNRRNSNGNITIIR